MRTTGRIRTRYGALAGDRRTFPQQRSSPWEQQVGQQQSQHDLASRTPGDHVTPTAVTSAAVGSLRRLGPFVARDEHLARLLALVDDHTSVISIVGPAGVGKTRLASELLARRPGALVACESIDDWASVPGEVLRTLTGEDELSTSSSERRTRLAHQLVVVDSLDRVLAAAPGLVEIADVYPGLSIVVTTNEPLRVRGEALVELRGLSVPADPDQLATSAAIDLLCYHARRRRPDFEVHADDAPALVELCGLVDGLPLGLEILGDRLKRRSPPQLLAELREDFTRLRHHSREVPERHQSLDAAVRWSLQTCDADDLALLAILAVAEVSVPVGVVLDVSAELGLLGSADRGGAEDRLELLCDRHLAAWTLTDGTERISVGATLRHVLVAQLDPQRRRAIATALAQWFGAAIDARTAEGLSVAGARWLEAEHLNVRRGMSWWVTEDPHRLVATVLALAPWWILTGRYREAVEWTAQALERVDEPEARLRLLLGSAELLAVVHDPLGASRAAEEALAMSREIENPALVALAAITYAETCLLGASTATIEPLLARVAGACDDPVVTVRLSRLQASQARRRGELGEADRFLQRALAAAVGRDDAPAEAAILGELGTVAGQEGNIDAAAAYLERSLAVAVALGRATPHQAMALAEVAHLDFQRRRFPQARARVERALEVAERVASELDIALICELRGIVLTECGEIALARSELRRALAAYQRLGAREQLVAGLSDVGAVNVGLPPERTVPLLAATSTADPEEAHVGGHFWEARRRRVLDAHRASLGDERFEHLWRTGSAWSLDQAADDARAALADEPDTRPTLVGLSARETEVALLVAEGLTDKEIADRLVIGVRTVNTHVSTILRKACVDRRGEVRDWVRSRQGARDP